MFLCSLFDYITNTTSPLTPESLVGITDVGTIIIKDTFFASFVVYHEDLLD